MAQQKEVVEIELVVLEVEVEVEAEAEVVAVAEVEVVVVLVIVIKHCLKKQIVEVRIRFVSQKFFFSIKKDEFEIFFCFCAYSRWMNSKKKFFLGGLVSQRKNFPLFLFFFVLGVNAGAIFRKKNFMSWLAHKQLWKLGANHKFSLTKNLSFALFLKKKTFCLVVLMNII